MIKKSLYVIAVPIFIASLVYFICRFSDDNFRDGAMGNLFATMIGLIVGIPVGLEINRHQQAEFEKKDNKNREKIKREEFKVYFDRLEDEIQHNEIRVETLSATLPLSSHARKDMWDLASVIVDSFSFKVNDDFYSAGLNLFLPDNIETKVFTVYAELRRLFHDIKTAVHAHAFYYGYSTAGEKQSNELFEKIKNDAEKVGLLLDKTLDELAKYRAKGMLN